MPILFERTLYAGWENCFRLTNDQVELIITGDVGPRVMRFGFAGEANMFAENAEDLGKTGGDEWRVYGGHRFWHAPEAVPRTTMPDNDPVDVVWDGTVVYVRQPVEAGTGIQKELTISMAADVPQVTVTHRLTNCGLWGVELAPWALSVMASGGTAVIPLPPRGTHPEHLQPTSVLSLWAYTDLSDPRWGWGRQYILLRQMVDAAPQPQKVGVANSDGWTAYANLGNLFVKTFTYDVSATYPDLGSSTEVFTDRSILEVETLGAMTRLAPNESVELLETWALFRDVPVPNSDQDVEQHILPHVRSMR